MVATSADGVAADTATLQTCSCTGQSRIWHSALQYARAWQLEQRKRPKAPQRHVVVLAIAPVSAGKVACAACAAADADVGRASGTADDGGEPRREMESRRFCAGSDSSVRSASADRRSDVDAASGALCACACACACCAARRGSRDGSLIATKRGSVDAPPALAVRTPCPCGSATDDAGAGAVFIVPGDADTTRASGCAGCCGPLGSDPEGVLGATCPEGALPSGDTRGDAEDKGPIGPLCVAEGDGASCPGRCE